MEVQNQRRFFVCAKYLNAKLSIMVWEADGDSGSPGIHLLRNKISRTKKCSSMWCLELSR